MIILSKKRILVIMSFILASVFTFVLQTGKMENTIQTVSLPISNKVIVLDARTWNT